MASSSELLMKKGKALCFSSYHLPSIPTDIYRIFILKHPLFISLSLSFSTSRSVSFSLSLSLSWLGSAVKQINKLWQKKQAAPPPPPPPHTHTHTHTHTQTHTHTLSLGTCDTRRARWEQKERYVAREKRRGSVRTSASVQSCISVKACLSEYVCVYSELYGEWGFYLGDCKSLDHLWTVNILYFIELSLFACLSVSFWSLKV